ncbi:O-succinylbenzoate synthase [Trueperella bonasi]|uniref:o-succinylbenzoate synthase n=1 Tax=Trueperella bonasi TaxID=312286 RepID=A0ABT9NGZ3_9ACTO|nr:o-succinylbenzoate synthase [Trueperella bonasi]MDP9806676.1 O-succinylbenzoate synthase [Trueperella bonasi]
MEIYVYRLKFKNRFRGLTERDGLLLRGRAGWAEVSPFWDYDDAVAATWLAAGFEAAQRGYPKHVRNVIPVNETIPAVDAHTAHRLATASTCGTFKVKIAEHPDSLAEDVARLEVVRDAQPNAKIRVDANGAWNVDTAVKHILLMEQAAGGLEYVEQPCRTVEDMAAVRRRVEVPIAADESIRLDHAIDDIKRKGAADIAIVKNQPLGGVRATLERFASYGMPVVVSSAVESSVGLRAGLALAASLPQLPHACGLATSRLFERDVTADPLVPRGGYIEIRDVVPEHSEAIDDELIERWRLRLEAMWQRAERRGLVGGRYTFMGRFV